MKKIGHIVMMLLTLVFSTTLHAQISTAKPKVHRLQGEASYYAHYHHGKRTANGEYFNMYANTAAHKTIPLGSTVRVTNLKNGKSVVVRINDRGPYAKGRIIDLSLGVAQKLDMIKAGTAKVKIEPIYIAKKFMYHHKPKKTRS